MSRNSMYLLQVITESCNSCKAYAATGLKTVIGTPGQTLNQFARQLVAEVSISNRTQGPASTSTRQILGVHEVGKHTTHGYLACSACMTRPDCMIHIKTWSALLRLLNAQPYSSCMLN